MIDINLSNSKGRDAVVQALNVHAPKRIRWIDADGRQAQTVHVLKATVELEADALAAKAGGLPQVAALLVAGDPELDIERIGSFLPSLTRVYIDPDKKLVHRVRQVDVVKDVQGVERERRPRKQPMPNVGGDQPPLRWTGKLIPRAEAIRRYVFSTTMQIAHVNGLTYDFLFGMAKELEDKDSLLRLGAGPKGNQRLVMRRGGIPYYGFLEGRTRGETYCLALHLSNLELKKAPDAPDPDAEGKA